MIDGILAQPHGACDIDDAGGASAPRPLAMMGEPYVSGFDPTQIADDLKQASLDLVEDLDGRQLAERYERTDANARQPPATVHVALARVHSADKAR